MRRLHIILLEALVLLVGAACAFGQTDYTTTPNLGLRKPKIGSTNFGVYINGDFDTLDAAIGQFHGGFVTVPFNATPVFNLTLGNTFQITLSGNVTSSTVNQPLITRGQFLYAIICQDGAGGHTFTFPASFQSPVPTVSFSSGICSASTWVWNGSLWINTGGSGGGGGGPNPAPPTNSLQKNNGSGGLAASAITDSGSVLAVTEPLQIPSGDLQITNGGFAGSVNATLTAARAYTLPDQSMLFTGSVAATPCLINSGFNCQQIQLPSSFADTCLTQQSASDTTNTSANCALTATHGGSALSINSRTTSASLPAVAGSFSAITESASRSTGVSALAGSSPNSTVGGQTAYALSAASNLQNAAHPLSLAAAIDVASPVNVSTGLAPTETPGTLYGIRVQDLLNLGTTTAAIQVDAQTGGTAINTGGSTPSTFGGTVTVGGLNIKNGANQLTFSNGISTNRTITIPDNTGTIAELNLAQTWTDHQSIANGKELRFFSNNATNYAGFKGGASTTNLIWLFPTTDSSGTQCLSSNGSLQLSWSACSAGTGTPGGANTQVQYNNAGSFGGASGFTFDGTSKATLGVAGASLGQLVLAGSTSGTVNIQPQATAGGTLTFTLPNASGTAQVSASAPIVASATTGNLTCPTCTTNAAALTANQLVIGGGSQATVALGSLGTTTTVLHGNAGGAPSFGAVNLATDTTGTTAIANGGTGQTTAGAAFNALAPATATGGLIVGTGANTYGNLAVGTNGLCLVSNGTTATWNSCAAGAVGGTGTSGQVAFWNATSAITGSANYTYASASGISLVQGANAADAFYTKRATDAAPTGNFLRFQNAAASQDLFKVDVSGNLSVLGTISAGSGSSVSGTVNLAQGTAPALIANTVQLIAPTAVSASGLQLVYPGTASTGFIRWTNSSNVLTGAFTAASGIGACTNTVVTATNDNAPPTCSPTTGAMFGSQAANSVLAAPNGSAGSPSFRALVSGDIPPINLNLGGNGGITNTLPIANGGTNATTASAGFNNLSPMTTAGDVIYGGTSGAGTRLAAGTATQLLHSGTTPSWSAVSLTADVTGVLPLANGGTNASTGLTNTNGAVYSDGTKLVSTATGGAGTLCLTSVNGGVPSFGSCSGSSSTVWSSLTNPGADLALSMGTNKSVFTSGVYTAASSPWEFLDGNSSSTNPFFDIHTGASSTMLPIQVTAQGTANGVKMDTAGLLQALGTGGIKATTTSLTISTSSPLGGGGAFTGNLTLTCATCVTSGASLSSNAVVLGSGGGQGTATVAGITTDGTSVLTLGVAGASVGEVDFKNATSGTIALKPVTGALGTVTLSLPAATDTLVGKATSDTFTNKTEDAEGTGNVITRPFYISFSPSCNNATAGPGSFNVPTSGATTFSCSGTASTVGNADFVDASTTGVNTQGFLLPQGWTGNVDVRISWWANAASSNAVRWSVAMGCVAGGAAVNTGPSYNTASASNEAYTGTANQLKVSTFSAITTTGCAAGNQAFFQVQRIGGNAGDTLTATAELIEMQIEGRATK